MKHFFTLLCIFLLTQHLPAQVNMTDYISDDLFKTQAIVNRENNKETNKTEGEVFWEDNIQPGLDYWKKGELDEALEYFTNKADFYEEAPIFYYYLGAIYYEKQEYDEAIRVSTQALIHDPLFLEAKYIVGLSHVMKGDMKTGQKIMDELSQNLDYQVLGFHGLGIIASRKGNYYKTTQYYEKCLKADSSYKEVYLPLAYIYAYRNNNITRAVKKLNQAVSIDPTWEEARVTRAIFSLYKDKNTQQFQKDVKVLLEQDPENYHYHAVQGYLNIEINQYAKAVDNFRDAMNLEVSKSKVRYKFRSSLTRNKSMKAALNYYNEHKNDLSQSAQGYINQGICNFIKKKYKSAIANFDNSLAKEKHSLTYCLKALSQEMRWNVDQHRILALYDSAIIADSTNHIAYLNRGNLLLSKAQFQDALQDFNALVKLQRKSIIGYKNRGILFLRTGNYVHAYRDFSIALGLTQNDNDLFYNRGTAAFYVKKYENAITDFQQIIKKSPHDGEAYYMIAQCHLQLADTNQYISQLDSASKYRKYKSDYHKELLSIAKEHKLDETTQVALDRLVKSSFFNIKYRFDRAQLYFQRGKFKEAKSDFERIIRRDKKHAAAHYFLGKCLLQLGDEKQGQKELDKAKKLGYTELDDK